MTGTVIKSIDKSFFPLMEEFIFRETNKLRAAYNLQPNEVLLYIPDYVTRSYERYFYENRMYIPYPDESKIKFIHGITVINNWDNSVVITAKDAHLRNISPKILPAP